MASDKNHRPCLPLKPQEKKMNQPESAEKEFIIEIENTSK